MGWKERGLMLIQDVGCVKGSVWMQHATQTPPLPDILLKKKKKSYKQKFIATAASWKPTASHQV